MLASKNGRALAARMQRERVLTESDGPFAQINGNVLNPWDVENAIEELSVSYLSRVMK
jgi:TatD DNase family protein